MSLAGKTAIITGGGTGIGAAVALALSRAQVNVVVCGRRITPLAEVVAQIGAAEGSAEGSALYVQADVAREEDVARVVETAVAAYGAIDILVNNAGISGVGHIHTHSIETWDRVLAVNLRGPFLFCRAVLPLMRQQKSGHIINISSESGLEHYPGNGAYGVSKHALNALGEYVQRENQALGIRVNTICPGMVVTEMSQNTPGLDHAKCLYPEEVADLALWLLTRRLNNKIGRALLIQTMENPWR
jgi:NAD(P)-dependent dehydrogenase (short-subunit alcohol dehydrogenase family)